MEEDTIAVSLCILIIIASVSLRIKTRQETAQGMGTILYTQMRPILRSPFIDKKQQQQNKTKQKKKTVSRGCRIATGNKQPYFSLLVC